MWTDIVGKSMTAEEFRAYAKTIKLAGFKPTRIVLHNTAAPTLKQWHSSSVPQRIQNLVGYYRDQQKWSAGPHIFVADDLIWLFTPLDHKGVHSPSWNSISWGVEMVGDYDTEQFESGPGAKVRDNAVSVLASLCEIGKIQSTNIFLHREDPETTHNCPGHRVSKLDMQKRVHDELIRRRS